jgi:hypothetical protein
MAEVAASTVHLAKLLQFRERQACHPLGPDGSALVDAKLVSKDRKLVSPETSFLLYPALHRRTMRPAPAPMGPAHCRVARTAGRATRWASCAALGTSPSLSEQSQKDLPAGKSFSPRPGPVLVDAKLIEQRTKAQ